MAFFIYFRDMIKDYLHKISLDALFRETGLNAKQIAELAGISDPKNLGKWGQSKPDGSRPNYNAFIRLLEKGASVETLFGVEYGRRTPEASTADAVKDVRELVREEVAREIAAMRANGQL